MVVIIPILGLRLGELLLGVDVVGVEVEGTKVGLVLVEIREASKQRGE